MDWLDWLSTALAVVAVCWLAVVIVLLVRARIVWKRYGPRERAVAADGEGIVFSRGDGESVRVRWDDVAEIETFKVDCYSHDDIRLGFICTDERYFEVSEEDGGFAELVEGMTAALPSIPADWYDTVMRPAFATNHRVLWKRQHSCGAVE